MPKKGPLSFRERKAKKTGLRRRRWGRKGAGETGRERERRRERERGLREEEGGWHGTPERERKPLFSSLLPHNKYLSLAFYVLNTWRLYKGFMTLFSFFSHSGKWLKELRTLSLKKEGFGMDLVVVHTNLHLKYIIFHLKSFMTPGPLSATAWTSWSRCVPFVSISSMLFTV